MNEKAPKVESKAALKERSSSTGMTSLNASNMILTNLPDDVLYVILSYLDAATLGRVCQVCKFLMHLASADCIWALVADRNHNGNHIDDDWRQRYTISQKEKYRVSCNWAKSHFRDVSLLKNPVKLMPWLSYENGQIRLTTKNCIRHFDVQRTGHLSENTRRCLKGPRDDIAKFVCKNNLTVCGCSDGSIYGWKDKSACCVFSYKPHQSDVHCVDFVDDVVISGSRDATVQIASMQPDTFNNRVMDTLTVGARVWSLSVDPKGSLLMTGSSALNGVAPLTLWDLNSLEVISHLGRDLKRGAGVLDMKFESAQTLLTCGYDTYLRLWDLRTCTCVQKWEEPYDYVLYCLSTDNNHTIITGTQHYGMVRHWDTRKRLPVQAYFSGDRKSPVYSLAFDSQRIYVALDLSLNMIDFSARHKHKRSRY